jgi:hypothetical protein
MIPASGAGGPEFDSRSGPLTFDIFAKHIDDMNVHDVSLRDHFFLLLKGIESFLFNGRR